MTEILQKYFDKISEKDFVNLTKALDKNINYIVSSGYEYGISEDVMNDIHEFAKENGLVFNGYAPSNYNEINRSENNKNVEEIDNEIDKILKRLEIIDKEIIKNGEIIPSIKKGPKSFKMLDEKVEDENDKEINQEKANLLKLLTKKHENYQEQLDLYKIPEYSLYFYGQRHQEFNIYNFLKGLSYCEIWNVGTQNYDEKTNTVYLYFDAESG